MFTMFTVVEQVFGLHVHLIVTGAADYAGLSITGDLKGRLGHGMNSKL